MMSLAQRSKVARHIRSTSGQCDDVIDLACMQRAPIGLAEATHRKNLGATPAPCRVVTTACGGAASPFVRSPMTYALRLPGQVRTAGFGARCWLRPRHDHPLALNMCSPIISSPLMLLLPCMRVVFDPTSDGSKVSFILAVLRYRRGYFLSSKEKVIQTGLQEEGRRYFAQEDRRRQEEAIFPSGTTTAVCV